jgi:hypothetical protein
MSPDKPRGRPSQVAAPHKIISDHRGGTDNQSLPPAAVRPRRCAWLFPGLTGCPSPAEDGSKYCTAHQDAER